MNQHAVYTCLFGNYEELKPPTVPQTQPLKEGEKGPQLPVFDFYCFTDQDISCPPWRIIKVIPDLPPQRMARRIKLLPHIYLPNHRYTFWLDASFRIDCDLSKFWTQHFRSPLTAPKHPIRQCVYREIASCIHNNRGDVAELEQQRTAYQARKVPAFADNIITSGVLMRENTDLCRRFCDAWYAELAKFSTRDQVAFAGIVADFPYFTFKWDYSRRNNGELEYIHHFKNRKQ